MTDTAPIKPKRRWLRFSLRSLLLLVLVLCVVLGWQVGWARKQRAAVAWIRQQPDGSVAYDYERLQFPSPNPQPSAPNWLVELLGIDYFATVTRATVETEQADVSELAGLQASKTCTSRVAKSPTSRRWRRCRS